MKKSKVFVIGIDGASWDIFDKLMEQGVMPNLKNLVENYFSTNLESTLPPVTASAWASFITGMNPDRHGVYDFSRRKPGSYHTTINNAKSLKGKSLWKILSEQGKSVGVINVPMTYPPEDVNGFIIPGFLSPGVSSQQMITNPASLSDELKEQISDYKIFLDKSPRVTIETEGALGFLEKCTEIVDKRYEAAVFLYENYQPDFFMVHFLVTDVVQHWMWHVWDETHPEHDASTSAALLNAVHEFYSNLDDKFGGLLKIAGDDCDVILLSDHGFGPLQKTIFINHWLQQNGYLKLNQQKKQMIQTIRHIIARIDFLNLRNRVLPSGQKRVSLEKQLQHEMLINWKKTRAFATPASIYGNVFLNLKNREPRGTIEDGEKAELLKKELKEKLEQITDPTTGKKLIADVFFRDDIFPNDNQKLAPDLLIKPNAGNVIFSQLTSNRFLRDNIAWKDITGTHRVQGILVIKSRKTIRSAERKINARLVDLAPTILYLLNNPIPAVMDGKLLEPAFKTAVLEASPPEYVGNNFQELESNNGYTPEQEDIIRQRLQDLGYLE
ncbi:MAG TPA: hypothetical protein ENN22_05600 [bacterium]|nr:hypothetical protein [bacterium]